jgi:hypothetical protein
LLVDEEEPVVDIDTVVSEGECKGEKVLRIPMGIKENRERKLPVELVELNLVILQERQRMGV